MESLQGSQHSGPFLHELRILSFSHGPCPVLSVGESSREQERHTFSFKELTPNGKIAQKPLFVYFMHPSVMAALSVHRQSKVSVQWGWGDSWIGQLTPWPLWPPAISLSKALPLSLSMS